MQPPIYPRGTSYDPLQLLRIIHYNLSIHTVYVCLRFHTLLQPLHLCLPHVIRDIISSLAHAATCRLRHAPDVASAFADRQLLAELRMVYADHRRFTPVCRISGSASMWQSCILFTVVKLGGVASSVETSESFVGSRQPYALQPDHCGGCGSSLRHP